MKSLAVASRSFSRNEVLRNEVLKRYPDAKFNDEGLSLNGDSLVDFLNGYEKAILALETIDESILSRLPTLKIIGKYGVGLDMLDLPALRLLKPFNCKILAYDVLDFPEFYSEHNVLSSGLDNLLELSDVVSIHLPLDQSTKNILTEERLQLMKSDSILINLARGGLVDEIALKKILLSKKIAGAAIDVFAVEPPQDSDFSYMDNVLVTPHIGGSTKEAIYAMGMAAIDGLDNAKDPLDLK